MCTILPNHSSPLHEGHLTKSGANHWCCTMTNWCPHTEKSTPTERVYEDEEHACWMGIDVRTEKWNTEGMNLTHARWRWKAQQPQNTSCTGNRCPHRYIEHRRDQLHTRSMTVKAQLPRTKTRDPTKNWNTGLLIVRTQRESLRSTWCVEVVFTMHARYNCRGCRRQHH